MDELHVLAQGLNETLSGTIIGELLSSYGRRLYFPQGIVAQSNEAANLATWANATAGVALCNGSPMSLSFLRDALTCLSMNEIVGYAPTAGNPALRKRWWEEMVRKNPLLQSACCSLPVVTSGLTQSISLTASLFLDEGDTIIIPAPSWDNYELIMAVRNRCKVRRPPLFDQKETLAIDMLEDAIMASPTQKVALLFNFPHNPTGYTPLIEEADKLVDVLARCVAQGKYLLVILDDAYFGLFHEELIYTQSLFSRLCTLDERLLAVKCDAATKEAAVWGFRIGFLTFGAKLLTNDHYHAIVQKVMGAIRASVSSCSQIGQSLLLSAMGDTRYLLDTAFVAQKMKERYAIVRKAIEQHKDSVLLHPMPFNSGYFFSFLCKGDAQQLRKHLLDTYGIGTVALEGKLLRIAYSGVDDEKLADMIEKIYRGAEAIWT